MFCSKCGNQIPDGVKFCPSCGNPTAASAQQTFQGGPVRPEGAPAYGAPAPQPAPVGGYPRGPVQTDRSLAAYILLSLVTCGIYGLYFFYTLARDVNTMCDGDGESTPGLAAFILLSLVTAASMPTTGTTRSATACRPTRRATALAFQESGTTVLMWCIVGYLTCGIGNWVPCTSSSRTPTPWGAAYNARLLGR